MKDNWFFKLLIVSCSIWSATALNSAWRWECIGGFCQKRRINNSTETGAISLSVCQIFCSNNAALWPKPTGKVSVGNYLLPINANSIDIAGIAATAPSVSILRHAVQRLRQQTEQKGSAKARNKGGRAAFFYFDIADTSIVDPVLRIDESYSLFVSESSSGSLNVTIKAQNAFGARHAIETFGQLVVHDDLRDELVVPRDVEVEDAPVYTYRGLTLDTSRNFISVEAIKRNIDAMAASKLNRFHWHITDTHSFPFYSKSQPQLSKLGAYSPKKVYMPDQIEDIVEYARVRGVKVVPEFDAPAHVGEGWQDSGFVVCLNKQPWELYCVEPPCGQFDPTEDGLYDVLGDIYGDMFELFKPDIFHMGGDEISFSCWRSEEKILNWLNARGWNSSSEEENFTKLWNLFQTKAIAQLDFKAKTTLPIIMWTSELTRKENIQKYLPKDRYVIQVWTEGSDPQIKDLLDANYTLILSNYDALYLDCGFAGWVAGGNNWCSPYIGWQKVYSNSPYNISAGRTDQILGSSAALWTEQVDDSSVDGRFWPRAAALAEILWSEPKTTWREAEPRILIHRERLVRDTGVNAEALEPEWCLQNENNCPQN
ncbi:chitooligosaccharidolytic beta-N-acetylglucosaminidase [Agrilus planipennis]|uniref:Beta-hexosaminidase n=1 Tax=Agrilus planipennis TaxID=224129 RepID=A0A1W4XGX0_AGRPL|nr:chitooligosaccharidolytic beta-N-acetylglucosaminidase [Agrilus planipennis]XP_018331703.1 chitooligosaccharidolytic beta-N-acetylglucosaminidase [Agrilus planipennis]